jgi:hypothetical protein
VIGCEVAGALYILDSKGKKLGRIVHGYENVGSSGRTAAISIPFDHPVGTREQRCRHFEGSERLHRVDPSATSTAAPTSTGRWHSFGGLLGDGIAGGAELRTHRDRYCRGPDQG